MREVASLKKKWLSRNLCQRIREAITEVQLSRVAAAFSEIAISVTCDASVDLCDRLNHD